MRPTLPRRRSKPSSALGGCLSSGSHRSLDAQAGDTVKRYIRSASYERTGKSLLYLLEGGGGTNRSTFFKPLVSKCAEPSDGQCFYKECPCKQSKYTLTLRLLNITNERGFLVLTAHSA